ncbi:MAG: hypothetical protein HQM00_06745 [Magnetococcales bacterium]|nr:hypothetical protein [Magnetococcales bacterium]
MTDSRRREQSQILLVEGDNDCHVVIALCKHFNKPETFTVDPCGGDMAVLKKADALLREAPMKQAIGLMLDADDQAARDSRWEIIQKIMDLSEYDLSQGPLPEGTILTAPGKPKLGIWIMPDNSGPGRLEDFLMKMARPEALEQARLCVTMAVEKELTTFKPTHRAKAELHTYLAWQDEPGTPMGRSITRHALQPGNTPTARIFADWLTRLFDDRIAGLTAPD